MSLIALAVYSTEENKKDDCLQKTLAGLQETVDLNRHRIMVSVNGFTDRTMTILDWYGPIIQYVVSNDSNLGTAKAINKLWALRRPGENVVKMDDDIVIQDAGWADRLEEAIQRDPLIGQIGLKRKDCWENVRHEHPDWRSELKQLPHQPGESWIIVEKAKHIIGSCVMHNSRLIDKVGYLYQPSLYGYDDVIMSHRSYIAGFYSCFLPHIRIDHIDGGTTPYQDWKQKHSAEQTDGVIKLVHAMIRGEKSIYYAAD